MPRTTTLQYWPLRLLDEEWKSVAEKVYTPIEVLVDVVVKLISGSDIKDAKGVVKTKDQNWGLTVEVIGKN